MPRTYRPLRDRFFEKIRVDGECHIFTGKIMNAGYGMIISHHEELLAHRVAWTFAFGPIPEGLCVLHHCDVRACVNPSHLFLGTKGDNIRDAKAKGRNSNGGAKRTHCRRGHALTGSNLDPHSLKNGHRDCLRCRVIRNSAKRKFRKLTFADVRAIRAEAGKVPRRELARRYGVCPASISHVITRKTFAEV